MAEVTGRQGVRSEIACRPGWSGYRTFLEWSRAWHARGRAIICFLAIRCQTRPTILGDRRCGGGLSIGGDLARRIGRYRSRAISHRKARKRRFDAPEKRRTRDLGTGPTQLAVRDRPGEKTSGGVGVHLYFRTPLRTCKKRAFRPGKSKLTLRRAASKKDKSSMSAENEHANSRSTKCPFLTEGESAHLD